MHNKIATATKYRPYAVARHNTSLPAVVVGTLSCFTVLAAFKLCDYFLASVAQISQELI